MARKSRRGVVQAILDGFRQQNPKPSGLTRGGEGDALAGQRYVRGRELSPKECQDLYEENWLAGNIVDTLAEDLTQAGWAFTCPSNPDLEAAIENSYANISLKPAIYEAVRFALIDGDGYIGIGLRESGAVNLVSVPNKVQAVEYLHSFRRANVKNQVREENPLEETYGEWASYDIMTGSSGSQTTPVHAARIVHLQPFDSANSIWGNSIYRRTYDVIQVADNALWSVGQIVYQMVFKVLKVDYDEFRKVAAERHMTARDLMYEWAQDLNSLTMYVVDKGMEGIPPDDIQFPGLASNLGAIPAARDFILMVLSAATRVPQSRLVGNEQGRLSGAEWDAQTYYARIRAMQELHLQPAIEKITDYLLSAMGLDPSSIEYKIEFNPLYVENEATRATTERTQAETDAIYLDRDVLTPDEVRERRFDLKPLLGTLESEELPTETGTVEEAAE